MDYFSQVQRGIDYIEANLECDIQLPLVSKAAGMSHWHFQRTFRALTNETLKTYVRSRRLANSLTRLLGGSDRIIDIALAAGFESQESFTRAFKKSFGIPPGEYRRLGDKSLFLKKVKIDEEYLRHLSADVSLEPQLYDQAAMRIVGCATKFYSVDSDKNNIGDRLPSLWEGFLPRMSEIHGSVSGVCYGVVSHTSFDSELLNYIAGVEVRGDEEPPPDMATLEVPAARYAKFVHRGEAKTIDRTVNYAYSTWLSQSGMRHSYGPDLEFYGHQYHPTSPDSVMHYAIPICDG